MNGFEINKIIAALIFTVLVVFGIEKISDIIFNVEKPSQAAYVVEAPTIQTTTSASSEAGSVDIKALLAMGTLEHGKKVFKKCTACHVVAKGDIKNSELSKAIDFVRDPVSDKKLFVYHHIGIYGFTKNALNKYINLKRSNLELSRNLEQMRALENNMKIDVLYTDSDPLSVDTEADLEEIKNLMEK